MKTNKNTPNIQTFVDEYLQKAAVAKAVILETQLNHDSKLADILTLDELMRLTSQAVDQFCDQNALVRGWVRLDFDNADSAEDFQASITYNTNPEGEFTASKQETENEIAIQNVVDNYIRDVFSGSTSLNDEEFTLIAGNLRGFYSHLLKNKYIDTALILGRNKQ